MRQIEEIRMLMFEHQEKNGFDTVFDHIDDLLNEVEEGVSKMYYPVESLEEHPNEGEYYYYAEDGFSWVDIWTGVDCDLERFFAGNIFPCTPEGALGSHLKSLQLINETKG